MVRQLSNFRKRAGGGIRIGGTDLNLVGLAVDRNGNKIAQFKSVRSPRDRGFSIQTNQNLNKLHNPNRGIIYGQVSAVSGQERLAREIQTYISFYGTKRQRELAGFRMNPDAKHSAKPSDNRPTHYSTHPGNPNYVKYDRKLRR